MFPVHSTAARCCGCARFLRCDAVATHFFTQNRGLGLATANRYARDLVKAARETVGGRLSLVRQDHVVGIVEMGKG